MDWKQGKYWVTERLTEIAIKSDVLLQQNLSAHLVYQTLKHTGMPWSVFIYLFIIKTQFRNKWAEMNHNLTGDCHIKYENKGFEMEKKQAP